MPGRRGTSHVGWAPRKSLSSSSFRQTTARGLAGLLIAGAVVPIGAQSGSAFTGTVIANANVLNGSVTLLGAATVNIAGAGQSQYPGTPSTSLASLTGLGIDAVASAGAVSSTATADPLYDTAGSSADLAGVNLANGLVALGPTHAQCVATGAGVTASASVSGLNLGGGLTGTLPPGVLAPNTTVPLKLAGLTVGSIIVNYQSTANQGAGQYSTKVVAARVQISTAGLANVNADIGTSECGTTVPPQPTVSAITPTRGAEAGGTSVTVTGTGFLGTTDVRFGTTSAASYTINSLTSITAVAPAGTGTVDVRVVNPAGTSANTAADDFTYVPKPVITAINPTRGPTAGGTSVTITGTSLTGATAVSFGGTAATSFSADSATQITAVAPGRTSGPIDVRVTTIGGQSDVVTADQYTYVAVPAVTGISPSAGAIAGGTSVTITGTALANAISAKFGTITGTITANTGTSLTVTAPAGSAGTVDVTVTTVGGTSANTAADDFTYVGQPTVTNVSPSSGPAAGGTSVTITGTGFAGLSGATAVKFASTNATSYTVNSPTSITAVAPGGSTGTVDVTVTNPAGTSVASAADQYTYIALPSVTGVSPGTGPIGGGTTVTINGTGFTGATAVTFGAGNNASLVTVISPAQITATAPAHAAGQVDVRVVTPGGTSANTAADDYVYAAAPTVTILSPTAGPLAGGTSVTITGANLANATSVKFGSTNATTYTVNSATSITATSPLANSAGVVDVTVVTGGGTSAISAADRFTYTAAPVITSITPTQASSAGGSLLVTINGSGFTGVNALSGVKFDGQSVVAVPVSDSVITVALVPAHAVGPVYVSVTTPNGGTSAQTPGAVFTYVGAPTLTSVSAASGPVAGGNTVTLNGTGFTNVDTVNFGIVPITNFARVSDTQIAVTAPPGVAGNVNVSVLSLLYGASGNQAYQYLAAPNVVLVTPNSGPAAGGGQVTLTGTGFTGATDVRFGGVPADGPITVSSDLSITATAPAHAAGLVDVTVIAPGGTSSTIGTLNDFTYVAAPVVSSVTPSSGPATGLTSVTITGTGFTGMTGVTFGGTPATAVLNSDTTISVLLTPAHPAGDVNVAVSTLNGGTSAATAGSTYTYLGAPTLTSVAPNQGPLAGGSPVVLTGSGFNQATSVTFGLAGATFTKDSDTQITATVPAGLATVNVTVSAGVGNTSNSLPYTYVAAPSVLAMSPQTGTVDGGTVVTLTGLGFTGATDVKFGTTSAPGPITVSGDTSITVTTPAHGVGVVPVTVVAPGGTSTPVALLNDFTFIARPVVTAVSPDSGPTSGLTSVTITGSGFDTVALTGAVKFDGVNATYVKVSDTAITAATPAHGAGAVDVTVTTADGGTSVTGSAARFSYLGAPAVTGISPSTGPIAGGNTVTISGAGFTPTSTVLFGAVSLPSPTVNGSTSITVSAPAGLAGTVDVRVVTAGGTSSATSADDYTYVGTPVVSGLAPTAGGVAGGESVNITGSGFTGVTGVDFGGTAAVNPDVRSDTLIVATAPAHAAGVANVHVSTLIGGTSANQAANQYTYIAAPLVTGISPGSGSTDGGTTVTITGSGFSGATGVRFGNVVASNPTVVNDSTMTAVSPAGSAGTVHVTVAGLFANSTAVPAVQFTYLGRPDVTGLAPDSGGATGGTVVTISGTGFTPGSTVAFGGSAATGVQYVRATQLRATSPSGSAGVVDVAVTTNGGTSVTTGTRDDFRYVGTSTITTVNPNAGPIGGGDQVVINGTQFYDVTGVTFGGTPATAVTQNSPTQITVTTPAHAAGPVNVVVTTSAGGSSATASYTYQPLPTVTGVSPASGALAGGTTVTLTGSGFTGTGQVYFGTVPAATYTVDSDTQITATSPAMSMPGTFHVTLDGPYGTSAATAVDEFTYDGPPTLGSISPARGALAGGTLVTVTGTGFTSTSRMFLDGVEVLPVTFVDATTLRFSTPAHAAGSAPVEVRTTGGTSASVNFAYLDIPGITSLTPAQGPEAGGTAVVVHGSGFSTAGTVRFGPDAASFTIVSDTEISTTSPGGTGTVNVRIVADGGTSVVTPQTAFGYLPPPTVSGLAPASGPIAGGTQVTVTGTAFTNGTTVRFGSVPATGVTYLSPTQLTATAPSAGSASTVDVVATTVNGSSAVTGTGNDFRYVGAPSVTGVTPAAGPAAGGTVVTISGSGFTDATQVRFGTVLATGVTVSSDGSITVIAPAGSAGVVDLTVTGPGGTSATSSADQFRYAAPATITGVSPSTGSVAGGTTVTITGTGFTGATLVTFGGVNAPFTVVNDTTITVVTPPGVAGDRSVRVTTPGGISPVSAVATYTYAAAPSVSGLTPTVGPVAGGTLVTIMGTGFTGATSVSFGGSTVTPTVTSDTSLSVTAPAHVAGMLDVTVTGPLGVSATNTNSQFQFVEPNAAPVLSSITPARGPAAGGGSVRLTGIGFTGASSVTFGGVPAQFSVDSDTQITVTVPVDGTGTVTVRVTTPDGTSSESVAYTYVPLSELPQVDSLSPNVGPVAGGTVLTISGANFDEQTTVLFDGVPGAGVTLGPDAGGSALRPAVSSRIRAAYSNTLSVISPQHAEGPVSIEVTNAAGTTSFVESFTFIPVPAATTFTVRVPAATTSVIAPRGPDYTELEVDACGAPSGDGSVVVESKGQACVYTAPAAVGTDSFTMDVSDVLGQQATQTVQVAVTEGSGTGNGGGGGNDNGGGGGNDSGNGDGSGSGGSGGSGSNGGSGGSDGPGSGSATGSGGGNDDLAFTGTPYFLVPAIAFGFGLILVGSGIVSFGQLRGRRRR